jgi:hypothetical protein
MARIFLGFLSILFLPVSACACDARSEAVPFLFHLGPAAIRPSGFLETIGMYRSQTTGDSVNTRFGRLPLGESPAESLISAGHSRMQTCGEIGGFSGYIETDFLNTPGLEPFRFRQYWGEYRIGKWRILGGQAWSLLRPNRVGINSEGSLMNTLVVEPAYHVGLAGVRNRQVRITRDEGNWHIALSYEAGKNILGKVEHDSRRLHWEAIGLGSAHRHAGSFAAVLHASRRVDFVTQEVVSHGAGPELLNTIPAWVNAHSTVQGIEARVLPTLELFAYGGISYGGRSAGNRTVRQWTVGFLRHLFEERPWGAATAAAQFSQVDRSTWTGGSGLMNYVQVSFRYSLPSSRSLFDSRSRNPHAGVRATP